MGSEIDALLKQSIQDVFFAKTKRMLNIAKKRKEMAKLWIDRLNTLKAFNKWMLYEELTYAMVRAAYQQDLRKHYYTTLPLEKLNLLSPYIIETIVYDLEKEKINDL